MPINRGKRAIVVVALALVGCQPTALSIPARAETVTLRLQTTGTAEALLRDLAEGYRRANPGLRLAFRQSTTTYVRLLEDIQSATEPEYGITDYLEPGVEVWSAPIGSDQLAVITHPENPLATLSLAQIQAVFQGRATTWNEVGGSGLPVEVVSREPGSGTRLAFQLLALGRGQVTQQARLAPSSRAMLQIVSQTPGAIGYISLGEIDSSVHVVAVEGVLPTPRAADQYPLRMPLTIVGSEPPETPYLPFFAWLQGADGQSIIARRYTPLPPR